MSQDCAIALQPGKRAKLHLKKKIVVLNGTLEVFERAEILEIFELAGTLKWQLWFLLSGWWLLCTIICESTVPQAQNVCQV